MACRLARVAASRPPPLVVWSFPEGGGVRWDDHDVAGPFAAQQHAVQALADHPGAHPARVDDLDLEIEADLPAPVGLQPRPAAEHAGDVEHRLAYRVERDLLPSDHHEIR